MKHQLTTLFREYDPNICRWKRLDYEWGKLRYVKLLNTNYEKDWIINPHFVYILFLR